MLPHPSTDFKYKSIIEADLNLKGFFQEIICNKIYT